jgi:hypothetical protein
MITKKIVNSYNTLLKNNNNFNTIYNNDSLHINSQINNNINKDKPNSLTLNNNKKTKKISKSTDTSSGSEVFKVKGKTGKFQNKNFIIKKTFINNNDDLVKIKSKNECIIYKYIRNLVKYNICPFIYYGLQCKTKQINKKRTVQFLILNTNQKNTILKTLHDMIKPLLLKTNLQEFYIILFQIMYTLKCFDLIGIKHNDLHFGNIFLEIKLNKSNINYKPNNAYKSQTTNYSINDKTYEIPNIDYTVKIYDFDLASKNNRDENNRKNGKEFKESFKDDKVSEFKPIEFKANYNTTFLNNEDSVNFDVLKVLFEIHRKASLLINSTKQPIIAFIESLFNNPNPFATKNQPLTKDIKLDASKHNVDSYGNFKDSNFGNIKSIDDILDLIYKKIGKHHHTFNGKTYTTTNLYK